MGPWCHACGQRDLGTRVELKELVAEVVGETFEIEGRLPRTLVSIAFRPGHWLGEFLQGRRKSYASPLRFYLLMLFVCAIALGFAGQRLATELDHATAKLTWQDQDVRITAEGVNVLRPASLPPLREPLAYEPTDCRPDLDVLPYAPLCEQPWREPLLYTLYAHESLSCDGPAEGVLGRAFDGLGTLASEGGGVRRVTQALIKSWLQQIPLVVSLLVLTHGVWLAVLWFRHHLSTHAMVSLVLHGLGLLALTLLVLWPSPFVALVLFAWHQLHVVFGLKRAYGSSWPRTLLGYAATSVLWGLSALVVLVLAWFLVFNEVAQTYGH
ncbi:MAG: DUF3667 domain-containing protein [Myxococcales bacterium]|nr:DUF3667 domain-containing protein [Myxococcales bacterium]